MIDAVFHTTCNVNYHLQRQIRRCHALQCGGTDLNVLIFGLFKCEENKGSSSALIDASSASNNHQTKATTTLAQRSEQTGMQQAGTTERTIGAPTATGRSCLSCGKAQRRMWNQSPTGEQLLGWLTPRLGCEKCCGTPGRRTCPLGEIPCHGVFDHASLSVGNLPPESRPRTLRLSPTSCTNFDCERYVKNRLTEKQHTEQTGSCPKCPPTASQQKTNKHSLCPRRKMLALAGMVNNV